MDMSKYIGIFRIESEKYVKEMSDSLLALENDPENIEQMNTVFRAAHTFKGMSSTMGFREIVELTHEMENLIDRFRKGEFILNSSLIDILFKCLDTLEELVENTCKDMENGSQEREKETSNIYGSCPETCEILEILKAVNDLPKNFCSQNIEDCHLSTEIKSHQEEYDQQKKYCQETKNYQEEKYDQDKKKDQVGENPENDKEVKNVGITSEHVGITSEHVRIISEHTYENEKKVCEIRNEGTKPVLKPVFPKPNFKIKSIQSSRISTEKLDKLMNLVGELAINRSRIKELTGNIKFKELDLALSESYKLIKELQEEIIEARMLPLDQITHVYPRMIRDLARTQNKEVNFTIKGKEIKLDRTILEEIGDSLVHLLRNAIDHGIELPQKRLELGKEKAGTVTITASRQENFALIKIEDDGNGINIDEIRKIALGKGIISKEEAEKLREKELMQLIFAPGLSTTNTITDISGRGVGMDVVKNRIERLGGTVKVESKLGLGSSFELKLPLTIALYQAMLVKVGKEKYAIPFTNIVKNIEVNTEEVRYINRERAVVINKKIIPLLNLKKLFRLHVQEIHAQGIDRQKRTFQKKESIPVVIVERGGQEVGIIVDELIGKQEVIVKDFRSRLLGSTKGFSGATILGDGDVVLIIDVNSLI